MGRVATMLAHFYVSPLSEAEMRAVASDWADALSEFPQWAVSEACGEWVKTQDKKPTPAAIRRLCQQHFAVVEFTRQKAMRGPDGPTREPLPEHKREEMRTKLAEAGNATVQAMRERMGGKP